MKSTREFEIAWQGLKEGTHEFTYALDDRFLKRFATDDLIDLHQLSATVTVQFEKHLGFFLMRFDIGGTAHTACDRCGDDLELQLWDEFSLLVKLGEEEDVVNEAEEDDVVFIPRSETVLEIGKWLYEYLMLSVPLHRVHVNKEGEDGCNEAALRLLEELSGQNDQQPKPIWKGLDNIKIDKQ